MQQVPFFFMRMFLLFRSLVSDGWFSLRAVDLCVQVTQATGCRVGQFEQGLCVQSGELQIVIQRAVLMVACDQVQLRRGSSAINVSSNEPFRQIEELCYKIDIQLQTLHMNEIILNDMKCT